MNRPNDAKFTNLKDLLVLSTKDHVQGVADLMDVLKPFHQAREDTYDMSFARRGEVGVWYNLARKYDRIDGLAEDRFENGKDARILIDCLVDNAMYSLKWLDLLLRLSPAEFKEWVVGVYAKDCGISAEEALYRFGLIEDDEYLGSMDVMRGLDGKVEGVMSDKPIGHTYDILTRYE